MNHGIDTIDHNIIHIGFELDPLNKHKKYKIKKHKINLQLFEKRAEKEETQ